MRYLLLLSITALGFCNRLKAQQDYLVDIQFPKDMQRNSLSFAVNDGIEEKPFYFDTASKDHVRLSGKRYGYYAQVIVKYAADSNEVWKVFFVQSKPAVIRLQWVNGKIDFHTEQAVEADKMGAQDMKAYIKTEEDEFFSFYKKNLSQLGSNDSVTALMFRKGDTMAMKRNEFVRTHPELYYSFSLFHEEMLHSRMENADSLLAMYKAVFPEKYKQTAEGAEVEKLLNARVQIDKKGMAPLFEAVDIEGKPVSLEKLRGKYVLIDFWASWCRPCVAEMPVMRDIRAHYPVDKLEMISITDDVDSAAFHKARIQHEVKWRNIFGNMALRKLYNVNGIPSVFLVNPEGKIIYSRDIDMDGGLTKLSALLKEEL